MDIKGIFQNNNQSCCVEIYLGKGQSNERTDRIS